MCVCSDPWNVEQILQNKFEARKSKSMVPYMSFTCKYQFYTFIVTLFFFGLDQQFYMHKNFKRNLSFTYTLPGCTFIKILYFLYNVLFKSNLPIKLNILITQCILDISCNLYFIIIGASDLRNTRNIQTIKFNYNNHTNQTQL